MIPLSVDENLTGTEKGSFDEAYLKKTLEISGFKNRYEKLAQKGDTLLVKEANENATDFSGGEKQKLFFARALYKKAPFLILDEPTAALDPIAENETLECPGYALYLQGKFCRCESRIQGTVGGSQTVPACP